MHWHSFLKRKKILRTGQIRISGSMVNEEISLNCILREKRLQLIYIKFGVSFDTVFKISTPFLPAAWLLWKAQDKLTVKFF